MNSKLFNPSLYYRKIVTSLLERDPSSIKWVKHTLKTKELADPRPLKFNPKYPSFITGFSGDYTTVVMWLPESENIFKYYDDAFDIKRELFDRIEFTDRLPQPDYFIYS
jgi:hypothetical protein